MIQKRNIELKGNAGKKKVLDKSKNIRKNTKNAPKDRQKVEHYNEAATIFVGNLPVNTKRNHMSRLFKNYAPVYGIRFRSATGDFVHTNEQRKKAGSLNAWVQLKDEETAKRALDLNGSRFKGNHLRITSSDLNNSHFDSKRTVFVGNLKYSANEEKLREIFSSCGAIHYVRCLHNDKGCKGVAYVCFKAPEAVGLALELNETMLDERPINVERYSVKKQGGKAKRDSTDVEEHKGKNLKDTKKINSLPKKLCSENSSKKTKFSGVKIGGIKKKPKKKVTSQLQKLIQKIAPKPKPIG
ncbi:RNA-binding protein 34 [Eurosta solidaginis]|uniref:RNA-binding protein 34 n=1 Tax=Eurosta solidaginis TaxID=178769 RepID=UPI0035305804